MSSRIVRGCRPALIALLVALTVGTAAAQPLRPPDDPSSGWQRVVSQEGRFSVLMPEQPKMSTGTFQTRSNRPFRTTDYTLDRNDGRVYIVAYSDFEEGTTVNVDDIIASFANRMKGKVVSRIRTTIKGHPLDGVEVESADYRFRLGFFAIGARLYQITYGALGDRFSTSEAEAFMQSFSLSP